MRFLSVIALAALLAVSLAMPAHAEPLSGLLIGLKTLGGTAIGSLVLQVAAGVLPSLLARAMAGKPKQPGVRIEGTTGGEEIPQSFPMGRRAVGGHERYRNSHGTGGTPNEFFQMVISVSDVPGVALRRLRVNDKYTALGEDLHPQYGAPMLRFRRGGEDNGWIRFYDGTQTVADPDLVAAYSEDPDQPWTENHIGYGVAYAIITLRLNREVWQGLPTFRFVLDGIPLYDPRKDSTVGGSGPHRWDDPTTWEFSENLCVMTYNVMRGIPIPGGFIYGGKVPAEDLPLSNWIAGMNVCDVDLDVDLGGRKQFTGGYEVFVDREPAEIAEEYYKAGLGQISEVGGVFRTRWGAPDLPVYSFTDDDIVISASQKFDPFPSLQATHNAIRVTHPSASNLWEPVQTRLITNAGWEAADGGRRLTTLLSAGACFNHGQAQQIGQAYIEDARRFRTHTLVLPPDAQQLEPLDTTEWTSARGGYTDKLFEVGEVEYHAATGIVGVTLRERDPEDYDPSPGDDLPPPPELDPTPVDDRDVPTTTWSLSQAVVEDSTGAPRRPAFRITVDPDAFRDARVIRYRARVKATGEAIPPGRFSPEDGGTIVHDGVLAAEEYDVELRPIMDRATTWSAPKSVTTQDVRLGAGDLDDNILPDLFEEAGVTPIRIVEELPETGEDDELVWLRPESRLYRWDGTQWVTAAPPEFDWDDFPEDARPIRVVDTLPEFGEVDELVILRSENRIYRWNGTAWVPNVAEVDIDSFPPELRPVEVVEALPATGNFEGRLVLFEGDIYRFVDGEWTRNVPAEAINGELLAEQIADGAINTAKFAAGLRPVEIVATLPGTPHVQGRTVLLTSDNQLYRNTGSGWTKAVNAGDIAGQVAAAQIAALEASKITGQLTDSQIAQVAAAKLTGAIVASQIASGAVTTAKFATGLRPVEVVGSLPTSGNSAGRTVFLTTDNKLYRHTGSVWTAAVQSEDISGQLSDAQIAAIAAAKLTGQIVGTQITDSAITTAKLAAGAVTANEVAAGAIVADKIASNAISAAKIAAGAVEASKLAAGAVTAEKIATNAITAGKIAAGAVTANEIASGAITSSKVLVGNTDNLIPNPDFASGNLSSWYVWAGASNIDVVASDSAGIPSGAPTLNVARMEASGGTVSLFSHETVYQSDGDGIPVTPGDRYLVTIDVAAQSTVTAPLLLIPWFRTTSRSNFLSDYWDITPSVGSWTTHSFNLTVPANTYKLHLYVRWDSSAGGPLMFTNLRVVRRNTGELIVDGAITADKILAGAITTSKLSSDAVTADKIQSNAITAAKIMAGAIVAGKLATNSVVAENIVAGSIVAGKIATNAISAENIQADAITSAKIMAGAVTASEIAAGAITASKIAVGSVDDLVRDTEFQDQSFWFVDSLGQFILNAPDFWGPGAIGSIYSSNITNDGSTGISLVARHAKMVPIKEGVEYHYAFTMRRFNAGTGYGRMAAWFYDVNGDGNGSAVLGTIETSSTIPQENKGTFTPPSGTRFVRIGFQYRPGNSSGVIFRSASVREKNAGELIVDGAIATNHMTAGSIDADRLAANSITATQIAANTITATQIAAATITAAQLVARTITADRIATGAITATEIAAGSITGDRIAAATITGNRIAANTITATQIAANTITAAQIATGSITADRLNVGTIRAALIGAYAIQAENIAAGAITASKLTSGELITSSAQIANAIITNAKISGNIESDNYAESGGNPTAGFRLERSTGVIKGVGFIDRNGVVVGAISDVEYVFADTAVNYDTPIWNTWQTISTGYIGSDPLDVWEVLWGADIRGEWVTVGTGSEARAATFRIRKRTRQGGSWSAFDVIAEYETTNDVWAANSGSTIIAGPLQNAEFQFQWGVYGRTGGVTTNFRNRFLRASRVVR